MGTTFLERGAEGTELAPEHYECGSTSTYEADPREQRTMSGTGVTPRQARAQRRRSSKPSANSTSVAGSGIGLSV